MTLDNIAEWVVPLVFGLVLLGFLIDRLVWGRKRRYEIEAAQAAHILAGGDKVHIGMSSRMTSLLFGWGFMVLAIAFGTLSCWLFGADMWKAMGVVSGLLGVATVIVSIAAFVDA